MLMENSMESSLAKLRNFHQEIRKIEKDIRVLEKNLKPVVKTTDTGRKAGFIHPKWIIKQAVHRKTDSDMGLLFRGRWVELRIHRSEIGVFFSYPETQTTWTPTR